MDSILGHSQNFTDTVWIVGALGQAIYMSIHKIFSLKPIILFNKIKLILDNQGLGEKTKFRHRNIHLISAQTIQESNVPIVS